MKHSHAHHRGHRQVSNTQLCPLTQTESEELHLIYNPSGSFGLWILRLSYCFTIWLLQLKIITGLHDHGYFGHPEIINDSEY